MPVLPLERALADLAGEITGPALVRALASGRRRGHGAPDPERAEVRPLVLDGRPHLQVTARAGAAVRSTNHPLAGDADEAVAALLALPYATWHVETAAATVRLRVTKRGDAQVHRGAAPDAAGGSAASTAGTSGTAGGDGAGGRTATAPPAPHDRVKEHLLAPDDPLFAVLGADGAKRKQVDAFVRQLAATVPDDLAADRPLRMVDLGCGNAYLTMAAHRWLAGRPHGARTVGVELRADLVERSAARAAQVGLEGLTFRAGTIAEADPVPDLGGPPDVVLALHACDTATDDALARAVRWGAPVVLAAPCCHHDVQRQIGARTSTAPEPYALLVRHAILRERFADVLTDALRAALLRVLGHRVEVVEFVGSAHTPRNTLLRAVRTGAPPTPALVGEYEAMTAAWGVRPALAERLADEVGRATGAGDRRPGAAVPGTR